MNVGPRRLAVVGVGAVVAMVAVLAAAVLRAPTGGIPGQPAGPGETVVVYGRGGSFGVTGDVLPSGQTLGHRLVPGWKVPPGVGVAYAATAADGTVLWGGRSLEL